MQTLQSPKLLPTVDRPREKLFSRGANSLSDLELLQVLIGSGTRGNPVELLATEVFNLLKRRTDENVDLAELSKLHGLSFAKCTLVAAALELGKRYYEQSRVGLLSTEQLVNLVSDYAAEKQEHLICISLDGAFRLIAKRLISVGTLTSTLVHPREVFAEPITDRAAHVVLVHNHPTGIAEPSEQDLEITRQLVAAGKILGIGVWDHLIITQHNGYFSMREKVVIPDL